MSRTNKDKPWYVQQAQKNGKKVKSGFRQRDRQRFRPSGRGVTVDMDELEAEREAEIGQEDYQLFSRSFPKRGYHRWLQTSKNRRRRREARQLLANGEFDEVDNKGSHSDAAWEAW